MPSLTRLAQAFSKTLRIDILHLALSISFITVKCSLPSSSASREVDGHETYHDNFPRSTTVLALWPPIACEAVSLSIALTFRTVHLVRASSSSIHQKRPP